MKTLVFAISIPDEQAESVARVLNAIALGWQQDFRETHVSVRPTEFDTRDMWRLNALLSGEGEAEGQQGDEPVVTVRQRGREVASGAITPTGVEVVRGLILYREKVGQSI